MTFEKAEPDSGEEFKAISGPPETGRVGWVGTRRQPVLLRLVIPVGRDAGGASRESGASGASGAGGAGGASGASGARVRPVLRCGW